MTETYKSRGKGFMEIARDARKMLDLATSVDSKTGNDTLSVQDLVTILDQVDDETHFREPMAIALLELIFERGATLVMQPTVGPERGSA